MKWLGSGSPGRACFWIMVGLLIFSATAAAGQARLEFVAREAPAYPAEMLSSHLLGRVKIAFTVRHDGSVQKVRIIKSNHSGFEKGVVAAVQQWRARPWRVTRHAPASLKVTTELIFLPVPRIQPLRVMNRKGFTLLAQASLSAYSFSSACRYAHNNANPAG
ncbi:hypothetical protein PS3A_06120 [Pseudomonas sp. 3A(2025)]